MEVTPSSSEYYLEQIEASGDRPLCISREHSLPVIHFPNGTIDSVSGCTCPPLSESMQICVSASKTHPSNAVQDQGGEEDSAAGLAEMAHIALVS